MKDVYLSLGTNMGDRQAHLQQALAGLKTLPQSELVAISPIYQTAAWGKTDQADFLNLCVHLRTELGPQELLAQTQALELDLGRERHEKWGPRTIDIDILLFGDERIDRPNLKIPHPYMDQRAFVLVPLADIAGHVRHPVLDKKIGELLANLDGQEVELFR